MIQPLKRGRELIEEIETTPCRTPALWWLGQSGFVVKYHEIIFYIDPYLSDWLATGDGPGGGPRRRRIDSPLRPGEIRHADLILCTHRHAGHMDPGSLPRMLAASPQGKLVLPKSAAEYARSLGIDYARMTTTDADLRVEFFKGGIYARVYAAPSAHDQLEWTPLGGYPFLGYLLRFGGFTIYHPGDCIPYDGLVERLRPYNVTVALLPISGRGKQPRGGNFDVAEAAQLAEDIGARWLAPMHYDLFASDGTDVNRFIDHMLGQRPAQRFKIFQCGEGWIVPED